MKIIKELDIAMNKKREGIIDALLFISKIEKKRNEKFDFDKIEDKVRNYYENEYKIDIPKQFQVLYLNLGKTEDDYYDLNEINLEKGELVIDCIKKRIKFIKKSDLPTKYKIDFVTKLRDYFKELSPDMNVSDINRIILINKIKSLIALILFFIFSISFFIFKYIKVNIIGISNTPKKVIIYLIIDSVSFYGLFLIAHIALLLKGYCKKYSKRIIILSTIALMTLIPLVCDYNTDFNNYDFYGTYRVTEIESYNNNNNIKKLTMLNIKEGFVEYFFAPGSLNLEIGQTYKIKATKFSNTITYAEKIKK